MGNDSLINEISIYLYKLSNFAQIILHLHMDYRKVLNLSDWPCWPNLDIIYIFVSINVLLISVLYLILKQV